MIWDEMVEDEVDRNAPLIIEKSPGKEKLSMNRYRNGKNANALFC